MLSPKFILFSVIGMCLLLTILAMNGPGSAAADQAPIPKTSELTGAAKPIPTATRQPVLATATLDMARLAKSNTIDEADNARWSLVRGSPSGAKLYQSKTGVDWKTLRQVSQSGTFTLPAGKFWSFNQTFRDGVGYKIASGVLAGGHCALATVFRVAASRAGLPTEARQHRSPIPGFTLAESVNIWWGRDDLIVRNPTAQDLTLAWALTPDAITVSVISGKN
jgi:hypothetical protein